MLSSTIINQAVHELQVSSLVIQENPLVSRLYYVFLTSAYADFSSLSWVCFWMLRIYSLIIELL